MPNESSSSNPPGANAAPNAAERARIAFTRRFGSAPTVLARAPGRVNIIGEHVDYSEGFVLPMAVDFDAACALAPSESERWRVWSEEERSMVQLPDPGQTGVTPLVSLNERWANYVLGVLVGFEREGVRVPPMDLAIASDVPIGAGLSSSAALELSVATALAEALSAPLFGLPLARLCQEAEHRFAGVPCGLMDQIASALGRTGHAMLVDCRSLDVRFVPFPTGAALLAIDSGIRHRLEDGGYALRHRETQDAALALGVRTLRDADEALVRTRRIPELLARRARHVVREIQRTLLAASALHNGDLELLGMLMLQSHQSLRDEFAVSVPELDAIVDEVRTIGVSGGAYGARLTGGGFGGCAVTLVDAARAEQIAARISAGFQRRFRRPAPALRLRAAAGASILPRVAGNL